MLLSELLYKVAIVSVSGDTAKDILAVYADSRMVTPNSLFIAIKGTVHDGQAFINQAIEKGASAIITDQQLQKNYPNVTVVVVKDAAVACGIISHNFFGSPSDKLSITGVTGTNGKTTVATLLYKLFTSMGFKCGLIGTVEVKIGNTTLDATHTTPDSIRLNHLLHQMVEAGCSHVFMECSSHAIHQYRLEGIRFDGAIFTNITHDHLDYHKTFDAYIAAKKSWFDALPAQAFALTNVDDKRGSVMIQNTAAKKLTYSLKTLADFKGKVLENTLDGLMLLIDEKEVYFQLVGEFNAYNLLAVYGAAVSLGEPKETVLLHLSSITGAEGRFDKVQSKYKQVIGIVDYAHTPDALLNVLATVNKVREGDGRLITVVGCGGNRDKTKRPLMAAAACEYSDKVILTSDNPRFEDPNEILADMEAGVKVTQRKKYLVIADRKEAIKAAVDMASKKDVVLIAGKGHEKYQEINGVKHPFDDKTILAETLEMFEK